MSPAAQPLDRLSGRWGAANRVTAARATIVAALACCVPFVAGFDATAMWVLCGAAWIAFATDGLDGWLARRRDEASAFGARFDMETDAALGLVLCLLLWRGGEVGPWVLGLGLPRYLFLLAALAVPALNGELAPSLRRKLVCVIQVGALCTMLAPAVAPPVAASLGAVALVLLAWSFARDVRRLLGASRIGGTERASA